MNISWCKNMLCDLKYIQCMIIYYTYIIIHNLFNLLELQLAVTACSSGHYQILFRNILWHRYSVCFLAKPYVSFIFKSTIIPKKSWFCLMAVGLVSIKIKGPLVPGGYMLILPRNSSLCWKYYPKVEPIMPFVQ